MATKLLRSLNTAILIIGIVGIMSSAYLIARQVTQGRAWVSLAESLLAFAAIALMGMGAFRALRTHSRIPNRYLVGTLVAVMCYLVIQVILK